MSLDSHQKAYVIPQWLITVQDTEAELREKLLTGGHTGRGRPPWDLNSGLWSQRQGYNHTMNGNEAFRKGKIPSPLLQKKKLRLREVPLPPEHLFHIYMYLWKKKVSTKLHLTSPGYATERSPKSLPFYGPQHSSLTRK